MVGLALSAVSTGKITNNLPKIKTGSISYNSKPIINVSSVPGPLLMHYDLQMKELTPREIKGTTI